MTTPEVYDFDQYVLDVGERRLSKSGQVVPLAPKAHEVLVALVRRAGMLVLKRELLDLVWHDACVEEGILSVHVSALRKVLDGDGGGKRHIETVPRPGYRFSAAVRRRQLTTDAFSMRWPVGVLPVQPAVSELIGRGRAHLLTASMSDVPKGGGGFPVGDRARSELIEELRNVYASDGRSGVVQYALAINTKASPVQLALLFGEAGNLDEAFRHLDVGIARHDPALVHLAVAPQWDRLRGDSRFEERLRRIGLDARLERVDQRRP